MSKKEFLAKLKYGSKLDELKTIRDELAHWEANPPSGIGTAVWDAFDKFIKVAKQIDEDVIITTAHDAVLFVEKLIQEA